MSVESLKFYLSTEQQCSYLPDRRSASVFADPQGFMSTKLYSVLINNGFRRSADFVYRPHCSQCNACKPTRIPVEDFKQNRNQKRVWKKNSDVSAFERKPEFNQEHFELYKKYVHARHSEGEMDHQNPERYFEFLNSTWCNTRFIEFRLKDKLIAVAVTDHLTNGLSALYTFFDPDLEDRSLGTYAVLWQIKRCEQIKKKWLYLGYWISDCKKMQYKKNFQPLEIFENDEWIVLNV